MKKFYITTTLPYVNAEPHIGFALEIIQADVIARYYRSLGYKVFFNTGTDEHGLKVFRGAQKDKLEPQAYCDAYTKKYNNLKKALNLSYNSFIRTTDLHHKKAAQEFWLRCYENGDIYKKDYKIKYCVGCELEKTESELKQGKCPIHPNQNLEIIQEENYFFRYSKYKDKLLKIYQKNPNFVIPKSRFNEIKEFTKQGLKDFSISRLKEKMPWGVSVPDDNKHVMFVWFDALINYISSLDWPDDLKNFNDFWPGLQVAGKDNLRQQSSMWQAMLLSAGLPISKQIFIHGFITVDEKKMSKSLGNVINPFELVEKYGTDSVRYYLLREIPSTEDGDFTYEKFEARHNSDLAGGIGNLLARVCSMAEKLKTPAFAKATAGKQNLKIKKQIKETEQKYKKALEEFKFNLALASIWELVSYCDRYIEKEKPWQGEKNSGQVLSDLLYILENIAEMLKPFLPETSERILGEIERDGKTGKFKNKRGKLLFPKIGS